MEINNLSSSQNFQGYLKFKTTKNVVKTIDPSKIAAIVTGVAGICRLSSSYARRARPRRGT